MANPTRTPGLRGANRRDPAKSVPILERYLRPWEGPVQRRLGAFGEYQGGTLPPVPNTDIDRASLVPDWPMYANGPDPSWTGQPCGDCTFAGAAHFMAAQAVYAGHPLPVFTAATVVAGYSAVSGYDPATGANDNGADPTDVLNWLIRDGLTDPTGLAHKVVAWAAFGDPRNVPLHTQVLDTFGCSYTAIDCRQAQEDQFAQQVPWQPVAGSPDLGGHMVTLQRRRVGVIGVMEYVTWGAIQNATRAFVRQQVTEAYAVVTQDWLNMNGYTVQGLDLEELIADCKDV